MKKKLLAVLLTGAMVMSMLTACGGGSEETSTDTAAEEVVEEEDTAEDSAADGMCSDETFSALQDNYASMVEAYNAVKDLYESDEIEADDSIEDVMNQAADVINEMGEISQDTIGILTVHRPCIKALQHCLGCPVQYRFNSIRSIFFIYLFIFLIDHNFTLLLPCLFPLHIWLVFSNL